MVVAITTQSGVVNLPNAGGKVSWFGGPVDGHLRRSEPNWTNTHRLAELDPDGYYCAMRWPLNEPGLRHLDCAYARKTWWAQRAILVYNRSRSRVVCCWVADWGPARSTGRAIDVSPGAMAHLRVKTDDYVHIEFAPPGIEPGPTTVKEIDNARQTE